MRLKLSERHSYFTGVCRRLFQLLRAVYNSMANDYHLTRGVASESPPPPPPPQHTHSNSLNPSPSTESSLVHWILPHPLNTLNPLHIHCTLPHPLNPGSEPSPHPLNSPLIHGILPPPTEPSKMHGSLAHPLNPPTSTESSHRPLKPLPQPLNPPTTTEPAYVHWTSPHPLNQPTAIVCN